MKRHAPAAARNGTAIAAVLAGELPPTGTVLEIASGSGEHAVRFAREFPALFWQPSDADPEAVASIAAWTDDSALANLRPPIQLDAAAKEWPRIEADAILCVNMVHIAPWIAAQGLFAGAGRILSAGAPLIIYGPFIESGTKTAASNIAFDASLKARDPRWGLRDMADIDRLAAVAGLTRTARHPMPANNLTLVYRKPQ